MNIINLFEQSNSIHQYIKLIKEYEQITKGQPWDAKGAARHIINGGLPMDLIGQGSYKDVYKIGDSFVLKITNYHFGHETIKQEVEVSKQLGNIVARVFDSSPDYNWVVTEFAHTFKYADEFDLFVKENYPIYYIARGNCFDDKLGKPYVLTDQIIQAGSTMFVNFVAGIKKDIKGFLSLMTKRKFEMIFDAELERSFEPIFRVHREPFRSFCINFKTINGHYPFDIKRVIADPKAEYMEMINLFKEHIKQIEPYMQLFLATVQRFKIDDLHAGNIGWVQSGTNKRMVVIDFIVQTN